MDPKKDPTRRCIKVTEWPAVDQAAWQSAMSYGRLCDLGGRGAEWSPKMKTTIMKSYGRWLTWLTLNGHLVEDGLLGNRITRERVLEYVSALQIVNAPFTVRSRILNLYFAAIAMAPTDDWTWLLALSSRLRRLAVPVRNKAERIVAADRLFELGLALMKEADCDKDMAALRRAEMYRDGLMVAFLAARPVRLDNLASMTFGAQFWAAANGYWVHFDGNKTKNGGDFDAPVPAGLNTRFERYLSLYRPTLLECNVTRRHRKAPRIERDSALWISSDGTAMSQGTIYYRLTKITKAKFGHPINPHLFRDCVATTIALDSPALAHITPAVLGHANAGSEKSYNHANSISAFRDLHSVVLELRDGEGSPLRAVHILAEAYPALAK